MRGLSLLILCLVVIMATTCEAGGEESWRAWSEGLWSTIEMKGRGIVNYLNNIYEIVKEAFRKVGRL